MEKYSFIINDNIIANEKPAYEIVISINLGFSEKEIDKLDEILREDIVLKSFLQIKHFGIEFGMLWENTIGYNIQEIKKHLIEKYNALEAQDNMLYWENRSQAEIAKEYLESLSVMKKITE